MMRIRSRRMCLLDLPGEWRQRQRSVSFVFDGFNYMAIRHGWVHVVWNPSMVAPPFVADQSFIAVGHASDLIWSALVVTGDVHPHVALQYVNTTGSAATVLFRIDRPIAAPPVIVG